MSFLTSSKNLALITFYIITPSYGQIEWLKMCVASVDDRVAPTAQKMGTKPLGSGAVDERSGPRRGGTVRRTPSDGSHGVACPATAGTVPKGTKASGDAEAKADAIKSKLDDGSLGADTPAAQGIHDGPNL